MASTAALDSYATSGKASPTAIQRGVARLVKRRVHITLVFFAAVVFWSLASGVRPHDLTDVRDIQSWIGLALVVFGVVIRSWAAGTLRKHAELTTVGPYSLIRNPLYVGSFMLMVGYCMLIGQAYNLCIVAGPFALLFLYTVRHEEKILAEQYGSVWNSYADVTPRFIPRRLLAHSGNWSIRQWKKNREYQAALAAAVGLLALQAYQSL